MRWPTALLDRAEKPAAGPAPGGRETAPAAHASPGVAALLTALRGSAGRRLLDLGPACAANLTVYAANARAFRFADLLRASAPVTAESVAELLSAGEERFDAILLWNALDYLDAGQSRALAACLASCAVPGTRLYGLVSTGAEMPALPGRFEIVDVEHVAFRPGSAEGRRCPQVPPAEVERRVAPFRVERAFLLRHGVREFVAILPSEQY